MKISRTIVVLDSAELYAERSFWALAWGAVGQRGLTLVVRTTHRGEGPAARFGGTFR